MTSLNDRTAALIIHHEVQPSEQSRYEAWLKTIAPEAQRFSGHMGVQIIRPYKPSTKYTIVLRFDSDEHLESWLGSETRKRFIDEIRPVLTKEEEIEVETGMEYWFTPPTTKQLHAKPYKQFLITLSAIFPLTVILPWMLEPLFNLMPILRVPILSKFLIAMSIVYLMVYVIMPRYTRLVATWLFK